MAWNGYGWRPYVPVWKRRIQAGTKMDSLRKKGVDIQPVVIEGRKIAKTFWGEAWCDHLESFSDYANRLPRGRTYVRNGSVCHLEINQGEILAKVAGSELYNLRIQIKTLPTAKWNAIKGRCAGQVGSLLELLQGRLSDHVMQVVTDRNDGLFPSPGEISLKCDCPDWAVMCKHVAAVLYGVGARLDRQPELLFKLRGVDHEELIAADAEAAVSAATSRGTSKRLSGGELSDVFGIDLDASDAAVSTSTPAKKRSRKAATDLGQPKAAKNDGGQDPCQEADKASGEKGGRQEDRQVSARSEAALPEARLFRKAGLLFVGGRGGHSDDEPVLSLSPSHAIIEAVALSEEDNVPVTIPDQLLSEAGLSEADAKLEIACRLYDAGKLTMPQATRWAGISRVELESALVERHLPLVRVDELYWQQEVEGLKRLGF